MILDLEVELVAEYPEHECYAIGTIIIDSSITPEKSL